MTQARHAQGNSQWKYSHDHAKSVRFPGTTHRGSSEWVNPLYVLLCGASIFQQGSALVALPRKGNAALLATMTERFNNA